MTPLDEVVAATADAEAAGVEAAGSMRERARARARACACGGRRRANNTQSSPRSLRACSRSFSPAIDGTEGFLSPLHPLSTSTIAVGGAEANGGRTPTNAIQYSSALIFGQSPTSSPLAKKSNACRGLCVCLRALPRQSFSLRSPPSLRPPYQVRRASSASSPPPSPFRRESAREGDKERASE